MHWETVVYSISQVITWSDYRRMEFNSLNRRNEVWSKAAQIMLIDTILKGIPIPKIYIKSIIREGKTYRVVVDGQQRLTAILKFVHDEFALNKPYEGEHQGKKFSELPIKVKDDVLRYGIDVNEIYNPSDEEIRDLYSRVNKYTVQLNKQELRKADFPGAFIELAEELAELPFFEQSRIFSVKQRRRMLDVEFVEELLTILMEGIQGKKDYLDNVCEKYMKLPQKSDIFSDFTGVIDDISLIFEEKIYPLSKTRFRQKSDFYSLFACILELRKNTNLKREKIDNAREKLKEMDEKIGPQSEDNQFLEYATRCLSDANSLANRLWRVQFMKARLTDLYSK